MKIPLNPNVKAKLARLAAFRWLAAASLLLLILAGTAAAQRAQSIDVIERLQGFDEYMAKTLKDWNAPGVGVGIVVNDKLVFAKVTATATMRRSSPIPRAP